MKKNNYISSDGTAYEIVSNAINSETKERAVIYRKSGESEIFVCSESWWNSQKLVSADEYAKRGITKYSPSNDKINLFMSLFVGRPDVYAKRWESKSGKSGYSPVCLNEWRPNICFKPSGKCAECEFKNYAALDAQTIKKHLNGTIIVGVYPLLIDETCRFLAIDFDDDNWQTDISAVFALCKKHSIPAYMERSRSGSGGHLWIFFKENISAATARKLGGCILTSAMNERHEIKFSSYDRLFPNQDTMPKRRFWQSYRLAFAKTASKEQ